MDERISSAVYNPANPYDTSTAMGNQALDDELVRHGMRYHRSRNAWANPLVQLAMVIAMVIAFFVLT